MTTAASDPTTAAFQRSAQAELCRQAALAVAPKKQHLKNMLFV
jgi:hypothetical protein